MLDRLVKAFSDLSGPVVGTPLGAIEIRDNLAAAEQVAEQIGAECEAMNREEFERIVSASEARPVIFRPDDPRLLVGAPPLKNDRERREYAAFRSALSIKEHEEARELRERTEVRRRNFLRGHGVDIGSYLAYCLNAVPGFEAFFFRGEATVFHS